MSSSLRMLLLEDTLYDAEIVIAEMEKAGYECEWDHIQTREEYLKRLNAPDYDLILSDYDLPSFDGIAALKLLIERDLDIPFIVVSGAIGEEVAIESLKAGATDYVLKGHLSRLGPVVARALREKETQRQSKLAEEALRESEEKCRAIFRGSLDVFMLVETESGCILDVNPAVGRVLGYQEETLKGKKFSKLFPPEPEISVEELLQKLRIYGAVFESQKFLRADGSICPVDLTATFIRWGKQEAILVTFRDVSEREETEKALRSSEERFSKAFNASPLPMSLSRLQDWRILAVNESFLQMSGYARSQVVGHTAEELDIWADSDQHARSRKIIESEGAIRNLEVEAFTKSGARRVVLMSAEVIELDGEACVLVTANDITERKRIEEALRQSQQSYESLVNSIDGIVWEADAETFEFSFVSQQAERLLDYPSEWWLTQSGFWKDHIHPEDVDEAVTYCVEATAEKKNHEFEYRMIAADGREIWLRDIVSVIVENDKPVSLRGVMVDITRRKQEEAERRQLEEQLLQAQKMESVGRLASGVAHDFNNLLTAIIGYSQIVLGRLNPDDSMYRATEEILKAGQRAAELTSQLLIFSRRQKLERKAVNINHTIGNLIKMLQRIIGEDVDIRVRTEPDLLTTFVDPTQIEQVIMNLAVNARDAMPEGGQLRIETDNVILDDAYCRDHFWARPGHYVQMTVADAGTGMDPETLQHIFEPFFTTKEAGKGTGLGLAVVYGIVRQHDGLIHVYSQPELGTTFKVYFPAQDEAISEQRPESQPPLRGGAETILVAEDEESLRKLAVHILEGLGYKVLLAGDGEEALEVYKAHQKQIDLVLLDMVMPKMGALETYKRIRLLDARIPVIFVTGYSKEIIQGNLIEEMGEVLIQKPYSISELGSKVRDALDLRAEGAMQSVEDKKERAESSRQ